MDGQGPAARLLIRTPELAQPVLERVVAALAARVDLPLDRLSDAQIASATLLVTAGRRLAGDVLCIELDGGPGEVVVRLGPLPDGAAARVVEDSAVPGVGAIVDRLVDSWSVERMDGAESVSLAITDGRGAPGR